MDKRLQKRHKREVARNKAKGRESVPDVRTPEQKLAAKEQSRPSGAERQGPTSLFGAPSRGTNANQAGRSAAKTDA